MHDYRTNAYKEPEPKPEKPFDWDSWFYVHTPIFILLLMVSFGCFIVAATVLPVTR